MNYQNRVVRCGPSGDSNELTHVKENALAPDSRWILSGSDIVDLSVYPLPAVGVAVVHDEQVGCDLWASKLRRAERDLQD